MEMARVAGLLFNEESGPEAAHAIHHDRLQRFFNAILERAAVECEEFGHNEDRPYDYGYRIRSLKLPTN